VNSGVLWGFWVLVGGLVDVFSWGWVWWFMGCCVLVAVGGWCALFEVVAGVEVSLYWWLGGLGFRLIDCGVACVWSCYVWCYMFVGGLFRWLGVLVCWVG